MVGSTFSPAVKCGNKSRYYHALANDIKAFYNFFGQRFHRLGKDKHTFFVFSWKYGILESKPLKTKMVFSQTLNTNTVQSL